MGVALAIYHLYIAGQRPQLLILTDWSVYYEKITFQTHFRQQQAVKKMSNQFLTFCISILMSSYGNVVLVET